jgi:hypothetical protein
MPSRSLDDVEHVAFLVGEAAIAEFARLADDRPGKDDASRFQLAARRLDVVDLEGEVVDAGIFLSSPGARPAGASASVTAGAWRRRYTGDRRASRPGNRPWGNERAVGQAGADPAGEGIELCASGLALHGSERHAPAAAPKERNSRVHRH